MNTEVPVEIKLLRIQYSPSAEGTLRENQPIISGKNLITCSRKADSEKEERQERARVPKLCV